MDQFSIPFLSILSIFKRMLVFPNRKLLIFLFFG
ncbi:Hypothetical protein SLY_0336 [Strawberry lethal yellows phytoplasma (CPA) str. NZSb11]|uniref:Uncharacterized protein n=1 Tax=Strawberry lethal yellows phytoplasma (CPA) str. NZSb11 TaxID=980422 RepID=R4RWK9_PHYAS|nr:Hypothetical protein SLY_0336 [Strawberry lethal yellows phytoplasma (CPA) str. NZSb11]